MKPIITKTKWLSSGVRGMALFPFVFINKQKTFAKTKYQQLITHETIHIQQQIELLVIFFYLWYVIEFFVRLAKFGSIDKAYRNISFEREAYDNEKFKNYLQVRKRYSFLKYLK